MFIQQTYSNRGNGPYHVESVALHVVKPESDVKNITCTTNVKLFFEDVFKNPRLKDAVNLDCTVEPKQANLHKNRNDDSVDQGVTNFKLEAIKFYEVHRSFHTHTFTTILQSLTTSIDASNIDTLIQDAAVHRVIFIIYRQNIFC